MIMGGGVDPNIKKKDEFSGSDYNGTRTSFIVRSDDNEQAH